MWLLSSLGRKPTVGQTLAFRVARGQPSEGSYICSVSSQWASTTIQDFFTLTTLLISAVGWPVTANMGNLDLWSCSKPNPISIKVRISASGPMVELLDGADGTCQNPGFIQVDFSKAPHGPKNQTNVFGAKSGFFTLAITSTGLIRGQCK